jgi:hypothetical protein
LPQSKYEGFEHSKNPKNRLTLNVFGHQENDLTETIGQITPVVQQKLQKPHFKITGGAMSTLN